MSDEPVALERHVPLPSQEDYEAIHAAVMETWRGRWFLAEYAKRNRNADTTALLTAIARIETALSLRDAAPAPEIKPDAVIATPDKSEQAEGHEEAAATIHAATARVRDALTRLQQMALSWRGGSGDVGGGVLQARIVEIADACMALDRACLLLERAPVDVQESEAAPVARDEALPANDRAGQADKLSPATPGPKKIALPPAPQLTPRATLANPAGQVAPPPVSRPLPEPAAERASLDQDKAPMAEATAPKMAEPKMVEPKAAEPKTIAVTPARDPLAPLMALSDEEKIAIFN